MAWEETGGAAFAFEPLLAAKSYMMLVSTRQTMSNITFFFIHIDVKLHSLVHVAYPRRFCYTANYVGLGLDEAPFMSTGFNIIL